MQVFINILLFYGILVVINVPAGLFGVSFDNSASRIWFAPPAYVISILWFILFTLYGIAHYKILQSGNQSLQWWLLGLAVLCASYAYYTIGLSNITGISSLWFGLVGNIVVIMFAVLVTYKFYTVMQTVSFLVVPTIVWTLYATFIIIAEMKEKGLF